MSIGKRRLLSRWRPLRDWCGLCKHPAHASSHGRQDWKRRLYWKQDRAKERDRIRKMIRRADTDSREILRGLE